MIKFHNPTIIDKVVVATSNISNEVRFKSTTAFNTSIVKVVVSDDFNVIKEYTLENGLLSFEDENKIVKYFYNGSDFQNYAGKELNVEITLIVSGQVEIKHKLKIENTRIDG
jgi:hypothetical protein